MDLEVRLSGNGRTLTTTAKAGRYEFSGLAAGNYGLSVVVPDGYTTSMPTRPAEIQNPRACFESDFGLTPSGRISGWVVDKSGRGVPKVEVEATGADIVLDRQKYLQTVSARSDDSGLFELRELPPGRYIVGLNLQDFPTQYRPVRPHHLSWRQRATDGDRARARSERESWTLGDSTAPGRDQVDGAITWKDGTPAAGVYVGLSDIGQNAASPARGAGGAMSGTDGRFVVDAREGRSYRFIARPAGTGPLLRISAPQIDARAGVGPIAIVIQQDPPR